MGPTRRTGNVSSRAGLRQRIVTALLLASLLPLGLVGAGAWLVLGRRLEEKTLELHAHVVEARATAIERYLTEHARALELAARTHHIDDVRDPRRLTALLEALNGRYEGAFVDLGVIDEDGNHLAYVGPYDLSGRSYADAPWFRSAATQGRHVSDVFLGYRGVPHLVIAVQSREDGRAWTLRATLNSERFASLVRTEDMGRTFDAYIVNSAGVYQTPPRQGEVLERSPIRDPRRHTGVSLERRDDANGRAILLTTTWLNDGRWQLVVQQDEAEVRAPLRQALGLGAIVMALAVIVVALATVLATRHLVGLVEVADGARDALARDLMRSAQLASVGEMATGLAHEINNPLAVIGAEQTNLGDLVGDLPESAANRAEMLDSIARCRRQVQRCGAITAKMLQFGRQGESRPRVVAAAERLREIASTVERQTAVSGVALAVDLAPDLPAILVDPVELEQVVVNLVNNALHATPRGGRIDIAAARDDAVVVIRVADTGAGIERANLDKVFQPFFTTKPVGKGTGLGLSVCHGLVRGWGGTLGIESEVGAGTVVTFTVPVAKEARQEPGR